MSIFFDMNEIEIKYQKKVKNRPKITSSKDAYSFLKDLYNENEKDYLEESFLLLLNRRNGIIGWRKLSSGGTSGCIIDPKLVFTIALKTGASGIILSHNHPSGNTEPSNSDKKITRQLADAGKLLGIPVLDHIIIGDGYRSMADECEM